MVRAETMRAAFTAYDPSLVDGFEMRLPRMRELATSARPGTRPLAMLLAGWGSMRDEPQRPGSRARRARLGRRALPRRRRQHRVAAAGDHRTGAVRGARSCSRDRRRGARRGSSERVGDAIPGRQRPRRVDRDPARQPRCCRGRAPRHARARARARAPVSGRRDPRLLRRRAARASRCRRPRRARRDDRARPDRRGHGRRDADRSPRAAAVRRRPQYRCDRRPAPRRRDLRCAPVHQPGCR